MAAAYFLETAHIFANLFCVDKQASIESTWAENEYKYKKSLMFIVPKWVLWEFFDEDIVLNSQTQSLIRSSYCRLGDQLIT